MRDRPDGTHRDRLFEAIEAADAGDELDVVADRDLDPAPIRSQIDRGRALDWTHAAPDAEPRGLRVTVGDELGDARPVVDVRDLQPWRRHEALLATVDELGVSARPAPTNANATRTSQRRRQTPRPRGPNRASTTGPEPARSGAGGRFELSPGLFRPRSVANGMPLASPVLVEASPRPDDRPQLAGRLGGDRILVPLLSTDAAATADQVRVASALARGSDATLHVAGRVATPDRTPTARGSELTPAAERNLLDWAVERVSRPAEIRLRHAHRLVDGVLRSIGRHDIDTVVVPSAADPGLLQGITERIALRAECDVVTVGGECGYEGVPSMLLAVGGGPYSGPATDVAHRIAVDCDAWIDVLHVVDEDAPAQRRRRAETRVEAAAERIGRPESTSTWIVESGRVAETIITQSTYYGLTVVGAPTKGRLRRFIAGSTSRTVRDNARSVVLSVRAD